MISINQRSKRLGNRLRTTLILAAAATPLAIAPFAHAIDRNWNTGTGNWNIAANWSPAAVPIAGDDVKIIENDAVDRFVTVNVNTAALKTLTIENTGTGTNTLSISGAFKLTTTDGQTIGNVGLGVVNQSAGTNTVGTSLGLGNFSTATGTYNLSGGTLTVGAQLYVGYFGEGNFNHSGGAATINRPCLIGNISGGSGTYTLSNSALLTTTSNEVIGNLGNGSYFQTGGTHHSGSAVIVGSNNSGIAGVSGGVWTIAGILVVGDNVGQFDQSAGSVQANNISSDSLVIGRFADSSGTYHLSGTGDLQVAGRENIGLAGKGFLEQFGGTHTVSDLLVGADAESSGVAYLSSGTWTVNNFAAIGWDGAGRFSQTGGKFTATGGLSIGAHPGSTGSFALSSGTVAASILDIGIQGDGSATFSSGTVSISSINVHETGTLTLGGATITANLINNSGRLVVTGNTTLNALTQGLTAFAQIDANLTINGALTNDLGSPIGGTGQIALGGTFTGWGTITPSFSGAANITARGGTLLFTGPSFSTSATLQNNVGATLIVQSPSAANLGNIVVNSAGGVVFSAPISINAGKSITLAGGVLSTGGLTNAATGTLTGFGQVVGSIANNGNISINGPSQFIGPVTNSATGVLTIKNSQLLITGATTNNGVIHAQAGGSIVFDGGLTGNPVAGSVPQGAASLEASSALLTPFVRQTSLTLGGTPGDPNSYPVATIRPKAEGGQTSLLGSLNFQTDGSGALLGKLDITDNALIVNYASFTSPLADIRKAIRSAYNASSAAHWTGAGLTSSIAAKVVGTALGYAEASDVLGLTGAQTADFQGQTADATSILVRYTLQGDTNLDGTVNFIDLVHVAQNYGLATGNATWSQGDSNYDGNVDFQDLVALAQHYGASLPAPVPSLASAPAAVPEPATTFLLLTGTGAIAFRRRSRR